MTRAASELISETPEVMGGYPVVANTTARNSCPYAGRPACCGANNCQPICPIDAQYTTT